MPVIRVYPQDFPESKSVADLFDYIRSHGMNIIRWESMFNDVAFVEVDNIPNPLPNLITLLDNFEFSIDRERRIKQEEVDKLYEAWKEEHKGHIKWKNTTE